VGAILGSSSILMTTINQKFPAPNGSDSAVVTGLLKLCGVTMMVALVLTIVGLVRRKKGAA
jgi:hypothetical protein